MSGTTWSFSPWVQVRSGRWRERCTPTRGPGNNRAARVNAIGRMCDLIEEVLSKDPDEIRRETQEVIAEQRQAG